MHPVLFDINESCIAIGLSPSSGSRCVGWTCSSFQQWKRMAMVVACSDDGRELFRCGPHTKLHLIEIKYKIHFHLAQSMIDSNLIQVSFYPK